METSAPADFIAREIERISEAACVREDAHVARMEPAAPFLLRGIRILYLRVITIMA